MPCTTQCATGDGNIKHVADDETTFAGTDVDEKATTTTGQQDGTELGTADRVENVQARREATSMEGSSDASFDSTNSSTWTGEQFTQYMLGNDDWRRPHKDLVDAENFNVRCKVRAWVDRR